MAHRTLINGTGYNVKGGRTLINGTGYSIKKGRTLINGTGYDVSFGPYLITPDTISQYFIVANSSYYFAGSGSTFTSNNTNVNSSTAKTTLIAKYDMTISFDYSVASEANYDELTITAAGTSVCTDLSGVNSGSYTGTIKMNQSITFSYTKDGSQSSNGDVATFSNMKVSDVKPGTPSNYSLIAFDSGNGDSSIITTCNRSYDVAQQSFTLTTRLTTNTDNKAVGGFRLRGLNVGDTVVLDYSFTTTASRGYYIDLVGNFEGDSTPVLVTTPPESGTKTFTATQAEMVIYIAVGRYSNYETYDTTIALNSLTVNGIAVRYIG